jgi:hypothetical protein
MTIVRTTFRVLPLLLALLAAAAPRAGAQDPAPGRRLVVSDTIYEVRLQDGSVFYGRVVSADAQRVVLVSDAGVRVELNRAQIRGASPVRGVIQPDGTVWTEDPNTTRLFFGPTGRTLRAGEGYLGAFELVLPFLSYGITDWLTVAGGTPIIPEVIGRVVYLAPKVQLVQTERATFSTGVLAFFNLADDDEFDETEVVGIGYGAGTWGSRDNSVSLGAGWAFAGTDVENRPAFMLGGEARMSRRAKLITENYLITTRESDYDPVTGTATEGTGFLGLVGGGVRLFGERLTGDLGIGLMLSSEDDPICCLPLVNFVYNFGSR